MSDINYREKVVKLIRGVEAKNILLTVDIFLMRDRYTIRKTVVIKMQNTQSSIIFVQQRLVVTS